MLNKLTYISIWILAVGLFMSTTLLAGFHIFIIAPVILNLKYCNLKSMSKSQIFLLLFSCAAILSVLFNQDIEIRGLVPITKVKYYLIAVFSIYPMQIAFEQFIDVEKRKKLLNGFLFFATLASVAGLIGLFTGFNPLSFKKACHATRNCGMSGMYMNYAHSLNYFMSILLGLIIYRDAIKKYISEKWLYLVFAINLFAFYESFTRGAWLGFLAAIPFALIKKKRKIVLSAIIATILVGTLSFLFIPKVNETFMNRKDSNDERVGSWKAAIKAFEERPVFGYGLRNFEPHSSELKIKYHLNNAYFVGHAHNIFLEILSNTGIVGFSFFILWLFFWFKEMLIRNDLFSHIAIPVIVSFIVGGLTQSTFILADNTFFITAFYMLSQVRFYEKK